MDSITNRLFPIIIIPFLMVSLFIPVMLFAETEELTENVISTENAEQDNTIQNLRSQIDGKNNELQALQEEREKLEEQLKEVGGASNALTGELQNINYRINGLGVSIRSNTLLIERLELEAQSLNYEISGTEKDIENTKATITKLLIELQQRDNENLLIIFLRNKNLAESVSEIQSIMTLGENLIMSVTDLKGLQDTLVKKVDEAQQKKRSKEIEQGALINRQDIVESQKTEKEYLLAQTRNEEKIYEQEIAELDKRQEEISRIVEEIEHELRESFDPDLLPLQRPGVLAFPMNNILITQCYGKTKFAQKAYRSKFHIGIDFQAPLGTPIFAVSDGIVAAVGNNDRGVARWQKYQFGKYIIVEHDNNLSTIYAHLSRWAVKEGSAVNKGDVIGYSGNTGYSTGPHLHFGVYWAPSIQYKKIAPAADLVPIGVTIDPASYLPNGGGIENCRP